MFIIKHKKIFFFISSALILLSLVSIFTFGLNLGIDFKGGALTEVVYKDSRPSQEALSSSLESLNFGEIFLQPTGDLGYIVKSKDLSDAEHALLLKALSGGEESALTELSFNSIGPSVGRELTRKAMTAVLLISLVIICFI
ncbi:MAG TPA: hypothetical protein VEA37_06340, partial [Flavobacterium sp.]|nr:hypothetical protein [Flavobacterium sp.]